MSDNYYTADGEEVTDGDDQKPYWICQECGHEDHNKPMPKDREKFYAHESPKCPKCKSVGFIPQGF